MLDALGNLFKLAACFALAVAGLWWGFRLIVPAPTAEQVTESDRQALIEYLPRPSPPDESDAVLSPGDIEVIESETPVDDQRFYHFRIPAAKIAPTKAAILSWYAKLSATVIDYDAEVVHSDTFDSRHPRPQWWAPPPAPAGDLLIIHLEHQDRTWFAFARETGDIYMMHHRLDW
jgi:hypothetical protein